MHVTIRLTKHCARETPCDSKLKSRFVVILSICSSFPVAAWLGGQRWPQHAPQDFEGCSDQAEKTAASVDERTSLIDQSDDSLQGAARRAAEHLL